MADWLNEYEKDDKTEEKWAPDEATDEIEAQEDAYDGQYGSEEDQPVLVRGRAVACCSGRDHGR